MAETSHACAWAKALMLRKSQVWSPTVCSSRKPKCVLPEPVFSWLSSSANREVITGPWNFFTTKISAAHHYASWGHHKWYSWTSEPRRRELMFLVLVGERQSWEHQLVSRESMKRTFMWSCKTSAEMKALKIPVASILFLELLGKFLQVFLLISEMHRYPIEAFCKRYRWLLHGYSIL